MQYTRSKYEITAYFSWDVPQSGGCKAWRFLCCSKSGVYLHFDQRTVAVTHTWCVGLLVTSYDIKRIANVHALSLLLSLPLSARSRVIFILMLRPGDERPLCDRAQDPQPARGGD